MEKRYSAGIVLFNPEIKRLKMNIQSVISQVDIIYLLDNGSSNGNEIDELLKCLENKKIKLIRSEKNRGIANALNRLKDAAEGIGKQRMVILIMIKYHMYWLLNKMGKLRKWQKISNFAIYCWVI